MFHFFFWWLSVLSFNSPAGWFLDFWKYTGGQANIYGINEYRFNLWLRRIKSYHVNDTLGKWKYGIKMKCTSIVWHTSFWWTIYNENDLFFITYICTLFIYIIFFAAQLVEGYARVSSQLVPWPTRTQVNPYPWSPLVTTFEKSTRNQSLGYELTFQKLSTKTRSQTYSLSRHLWLYLNFILYSATSILCSKCTTRLSKDVIWCFN